VALFPHARVDERAGSTSGGGGGGGRPSRAGAPLRPAGPGSPSGRGPPPSSRDQAAAELRTASRDGDDGRGGRRGG
jgi:hypothetical protein